MAYNSGYIYCLSNESFKEDIFKIGFTTRNPFIRMKELFNTSTPTEFKMVLCKEVNECSKTESVIHYLLKKNRIHKSREFFKIELDKVKNIFDMIEGEFIDDLKKVTTDDDYDEIEELEDLDKAKVLSEKKREVNEESESEEEEGEIRRFISFECEYCHKQFNRKYNLKRHYNERKYKCFDKHKSIVVKENDL